MIKKGKRKSERGPGKGSYQEAPIRAINMTYSLRDIRWTPSAS
jgi:hypothetical protein